MRGGEATPLPRPATRGKMQGKMQTWLRKVAAIVAATSRRRPLQRCLPGGTRVSRAVSGDPPETLRSVCANTADFHICASSDLCIGERVVERALRTRFGGRESPPPRRETHPSCRKRARRSRSTTLPPAIRQTGASQPRQQPTHGQSSSMCFTLCGVMGGAPGAASRSRSSPRLTSRAVGADDSGNPMPS